MGVEAGLGNKWNKQNDRQDKEKAKSIWEIHRDTSSNLMELFFFNCKTNHLSMQEKHTQNKIK